MEGESKSNELRTADILEVQLIEIDKIESEEERDLLSKTDGLWVCAQRREDEFGGYIYTFKIKDGFNEIDPHTFDGELIDRLIDLECDSFPAIQQGALDLMYIFDDRVGGLSVDEIVHRKTRYLTERYGNDPSVWEKKVKENLLIYSQYGHYFSSLGYQLRSEGNCVLLDLPDHKAIDARWKNLQKEIPSLPDFKVVLSEGVADEKAFIQAFLNDTIILSDGKEFVHDNTQHVMKLILRIFLSGNIDKEYGDEPGTYTKDINDDMRAVVGELFLKICSFEEKLKISCDRSIINQDYVKHNLILFGVIIDIFTSIEDPETAFKFMDQVDNGSVFEDVLKHPGWGKYLRERVGPGSGWLLMHSWMKVQNSEEGEL